MPLPEVAGLETIGADIWQAFARRLRAIGFDLEGVQRLDGATQALARPLRRPMRLWQLRRSTEPLALAMRALMFDDGIPEADARAALTGELVDRLLPGGYLRRREGALVSPFLLNVVEDLLVVTDALMPGGDAVMGAGPTTIALCAASIPTARLGSALELGCGAGTAAILLARHAERVVGTDVNPRAITLARVNAALNGVTNLELLVGDWLAPVAGRTFDLVVCQPPFVARPAARPAATYMYGGHRGDEVALTLLGELDRHRSPRGRAVFFVEWPELSADSFVDRVRAAIGPTDRLLIVRAPSVSLLEHCTEYAANEHPELGEAFERSAIERREHLEALEIRALRPTLTVVAREPAGPAWTAVVDAAPFAHVRPSGVRIAKILAARELLARDDDDALLATTLRVPKRTVVTEERAEPSPSAPKKLTMRPPSTALAPSAELNEATLQLISLIHGASSPASAIDFLVKSAGAPPKMARQQILAVARMGLESGLLQVDAT